MIRKSARNQDEVGQILDTCLELIANGSRTVDSVIEQYPEHAESLRPALEAALWLRSRSDVFNPRPGFVKLSKRRLVDRFRGSNSKSTATALETISRIPAFFQGRRVAVQYSALLTLTAVLLFVGFRSTSFLVQRSIPGDPLYSTKLTQENLRVSLSFDEEQDVLLRIEFAQRRVIEMQELILADRYWLLDETLDNFEFQIAEAAAGILAIAKTDEVKAAVMSSLFEETLTLPMNNLVGIVDASPDMVSAEFVQMLNVIATDVFDIQPFTPWVAITTVTPTGTFTFSITPSPSEAAVFAPDVFAYPNPTSSSFDNSVPPPIVQPSDPPFTKIKPTSTPALTITPTDPPAVKEKPTNTPTPTPSPTPEDDEGSGRDKPKKPKKPKPTPRHPNPHRPPSKKGE